MANATTGAVRKTEKFKETKRSSLVCRVHEEKQQQRCYPNDRFGVLLPYDFDRDHHTVYNIPGFNETSKTAECHFEFYLFTFDFTAVWSQAFLRGYNCRGLSFRSILPKRSHRSSCRNYQPSILPADGWHVWRCRCLFWRSWG